MVDFWLGARAGLSYGDVHVLFRGQDRLMEWEDEAFVLSARVHGETGAIVELLTQDRGKFAAHVSGAASRRILGTAVIAGMSMVTALGIFIVPVLFVVVEKLAGGKKGGTHPAAATAHGGGATAVAKGEHP